MRSVSSGRQPAAQPELPGPSFGVCGRAPGTYTQGAHGLPCGGLVGDKGIIPIYCIP